VGDGQGGPQPGPGGRPEQVGVGQGVAEHPLVGGAGQGQHGPDEPAEHHPGQAQLPQDGRLRRRQA